MRRGEIGRWELSVERGEAAVSVAAANSVPVMLALQPGARWRATMVPAASTRMHSVLVAPPSTPI